MNLSESVVTNELDQIIKRSALRIKQHRTDMERLPETGPEKTSAQRALTHMLAAFDKLKKYRAKFE